MGKIPRPSCLLTFRLFQQIAKVEKHWFRAPQNLFFNFYSFVVFFASSSVLKSLRVTWLPILWTKTPGTECCTLSLCQSQDSDPFLRSSFQLAKQSTPLWFKHSSLVRRAQGISVSLNTNRCNCLTNWMIVDVLLVNCIIQIKHGKSPGVCTLPSLRYIILWYSRRLFCIAYYDLTFSRRWGMNCPTQKLTIMVFVCLTSKWKDKMQTSSHFLLCCRDTNEKKNIPSQDLMGHCPVSAFLLSNIKPEFSLSSFHLIIFN